MTERRILIIDDNPDDIEACSRSLQTIKAINYSIEYATTPELGLKEITKKNYDCVIIDFYFPTLSGLELLQLIKDKLPFIPIVVLTGQADETTAVQLIKEGAQDYINKNLISPEKLHQVISDSIAKSSYEQKIDSNSSSYCNLLIIDDNPDDIEFCIRGLKRKSSRYRYQSATTGEEALPLINSLLPDCVILDYSLPGKTGLDVLQDILAQHPFIPVIIMTGQGNEMIAVEAIKNGADNYLVKSDLNADILDRNIKSAMQKKSLEGELAFKDKQLDKKQNQLSASYEFQNLVIESLPDLMFVKDSNYRIVKANEAFLNLHPEETRHKVIGYTTLESYTEKDSESFLATDKQAFETGYSETMETITFPNGSTRSLFTKKKRFENEYGQPFILVHAHDITEREQLIKQLEKSNEDLEQFAYIASHDLKSPLNAIKKLVDWIEVDHQDSLSPPVKEYFKLIKGRTNRMATLLDDLLDYSRINRQLEPDELIQLKPLVDNIQNLVGNSENYPIQLPDIHLHLPKVALQIVLLNLINNSIKHHHLAKGQIAIDISSASGGYNITVSDDGPGIPLAYEKKIFQMFQTLKPRDEVEGSGMGLALVKKIIEYYGGTIQLKPEVKSGTTFIIFWPIENNIIITESKETV